VPFPFEMAINHRELMKRRDSAGGKDRDSARGISSLLSLLARLIDELIHRAPVERRVMS